MADTPPGAHYWWPTIDAYEHREDGRVCRRPYGENAPWTYTVLRWFKRRCDRTHAPIILRPEDGWRDVGYTTDAGLSWTNTADESPEEQRARIIEGIRRIREDTGYRPHTDLYSPEEWALRDQISREFHEAMAEAVAEETERMLWGDGQGGVVPPEERGR